MAGLAHFPGFVSGALYIGEADAEGAGGSRTYICVTANGVVPVVPVVLSRIKAPQQQQGSLPKNSFPSEDCHSCVRIATVGTARDADSKVRRRYQKSYLRRPFATGVSNAL
jgi:hypothetical protein